jgi:hypothetical protein
VIEVLRIREDGDPLIRMNLGHTGVHRASDLTVLQRGPETDWRTLRQSREQRIQ